MKLKAIIHPADEGGFWAEVPALPGCVSEGETYDQTVSNIREAAEGWLEVAAERMSTTQDPQARVAEVEL
jgi:predicted RNase H-like HicB family nuclease